MTFDPTAVAKVAMQFEAVRSLVAIVHISVLAPSSSIGGSPDSDRPVPAFGVSRRVLPRLAQRNGQKENTVDPPKLNSGLIELDRSECLHLVGQENVGRLGIIVDGRPEIHPVNFAVAGEEILIRSDQGPKLFSALAGPVVFEVDRVDPVDRTGWSVMIHGTAHLTSGRARGSALQNRVLKTWREADLPQLLRIVPNAITGRRLPPPTPHRWPHAGTGPG